LSEKISVRWLRLFAEFGHGIVLPPRDVGGFGKWFSKRTRGVYLQIVLLRSDIVALPRIVPGGQLF